jgi:hypothetical protein
MKVVWEGSTKSIRPSEDSILDIEEVISISRAGVWIGSVLQDGSASQDGSALQDGSISQDGSVS